MPGGTPADLAPPGAQGISPFNKAIESETTAGWSVAHQLGFPAG